MNRLPLYFLSVPLMWKMLHKHSACQDKKLLLGEPGTALVGVLEDRTEVFCIWTLSVLFCCVCLMLPAFMITKNSPADLCFELVQIEGVGDEANKKPRCFLAQSDTTPGLMEKTRCCRTREITALPVPVPLP